MAFKFTVKKPAGQLPYPDIHIAVGPEAVDEVLADPANQAELDAIRDGARVPYLKRNDNDDTPDYWWDGVEWQPHPTLPEGDVTTWGREQLKQVLRLMGAKEDEVNGQPIAELRKLHAKKAV